MNICVLIGKILEDVEFNFIYNSKDISIAMCEIQLMNETQIKIYGIDEKADYMYSRLNKGDIILVSGSLNNMENEIRVKVNEIKKISSK